MLGLACIRCGDALFGEWYHGVAIERCLRCSGSWIDHDKLRSLVSRRTRMFGKRERDRLKRLRDRLAREKATSPSRTGCPRCGRLMEHWEYKASGVVLDRCERDGTWFDEGELEHVQLAAERGEEAARRASPALEAKASDLSAIEDAIRTEAFETPGRRETVYDVRSADGSVFAKYRVVRDGAVKQAGLLGERIFDSLRDLVTQVAGMGSFVLEEEPMHASLERSLRQHAAFGPGKDEYRYTARGKDGKAVAVFRVRKEGIPPPGRGKAEDPPVFDSLEALMAHAERRGVSSALELAFEGEPIVEAEAFVPFKDEDLARLFPGKKTAVHELSASLKDGEARVMFLPDDRREKERFLEELTGILFPERASKRKKQG